MKVVLTKMMITVVCVLAGLFAILWLGFHIQPKNFEVYNKTAQLTGQKDIKVNVPDTLNDYFDNCFADKVTDMKTSVVWGKAKMNIIGIWVPARFIAYYIPREGFYRYIEITWFGIPVINGYDLYYKDIAEFSIAGQLEAGDKIMQGQNLTLWAESVWSPSVFFTDDRLSWEENTESIILTIPFNDTSDYIGILLDEESGLPSGMEAMRYNGQSVHKQHWQIEFIEWDDFNGVVIPSKSSITWDDEKPWSYWNIEGVIYNIPVSDGFEEEIENYQGTGK